MFHMLSSTVSVYIAGDTRNRAAIMRMNPTLTAGWTWFSVSVSCITMRFPLFFKPFLI